MNSLFWRPVDMGGSGDFEAQIQGGESYFVIAIEDMKFKLKRINRTSPKEEFGVYNSLQDAKNAAERSMGRVTHAFSSASQTAIKEYGKDWRLLFSGL